MSKQPQTKSRSRGFSHASALMQSRIRRVSESRGFSESRILTHWAEIVGDSVASIARPVKVGYAQGGMGATLTVLTTGAQAPMLEMQKEQIRAKLNACYGYNAIARIHLTQTAPTGFAEGQAQFQHAPSRIKSPAPEDEQIARKLASGVGDSNLRLALEALGANVLHKSKPHN